MKIFNLICVMLLVFGFSAFADGPPAVPDADAAAAPAPAESGALRFRSKPDKHLWIYGFGGLQAGWWGVNTGGGAGGRHGVGARLNYGRCGGIFEWNTEHMDYYKPDPSSDLRVVGAGVSCQLGEFERRKFWRGAHFVVRAMAEYATNDYEIFGFQNRYVTSGRTYGGGGVVGADFHMPIFFGFWGFLGTGVEALKFKYNIPANNDDVRDGGDPTMNFFIRGGFAYAPF